MSWSAEFTLDGETEAIDVGRGLDGAKQTAASLAPPLPVDGLTIELVETSGRRIAAVVRSDGRGLEWCGDHAEQPAGAESERETAVAQVELVDVAPVESALAGEWCDAGQGSLFAEAIGS